MSFKSLLTSKTQSESLYFAELYKTVDLFTEIFHTAVSKLS